MAGAAGKNSKSGRPVVCVCDRVELLRGQAVGKRHSRGRLCHTSRPCHSGAFTLVEALLAAALLTVVVSAAVLPYSAGARCQDIASRQAVALELAQDLMEEILSRPFNDPAGSTTPGPDSGESFGDRASLDNVDDYNGFIEAPGHIRPNQQTAALDPLAGQLGRSAQVEYVRLSGQDSAQPMNVCRVTVHVTYKGADLATLTRMVYGNVSN
jgi:hypothetical protein